MKKKEMKKKNMGEVDNDEERIKGSGIRKTTRVDRYGVTPRHPARRVRLIIKGLKDI